MVTDIPPLHAGPGRPMDEWPDFHPVLVWDDYHGFVVAKRNPSQAGEWLLDLPYGFEQGGKEIPIKPVLWWSLPAVPAHMVRLTPR